MNLKNPSRTATNARVREIAPMSIVCARLRDARTGAVLALSASQAQQVLAAACAERIARWLGDAQAGFYRADGTFARLRPFDIAILVRQRAEAAAMRQQLRMRAIFQDASVIDHHQSIHGSNGGEPVRDGDDGFAPHHDGKAFLDGGFDF